MQFRLILAILMVLAIKAQAAPSPSPEPPSRPSEFPKQETKNQDLVKEFDVTVQSSRPAIHLRLVMHGNAENATCNAIVFDQPSSQPVHEFEVPCNADDTGEHDKAEPHFELRDANFDEFLDLDFQSGCDNHGGNCGESYFLYDPDKRRFEPEPHLQNVANVYIDRERRRISTANVSIHELSGREFEWQGARLVLLEEHHEECLDDCRAKWTTKSYSDGKVVKIDEEIRDLKNEPDDICFGWSRCERREGMER